MANGPASSQTTELERLTAARQAYEAKDFGRAFFLWLALAQNGNRAAYFNLGRLYITGEGAPRDPVEAYKWMHLSAEAGLPDAVATRARLTASMTLADIRQATERAEAWKQAHNIR